MFELIFELTPELGDPPDVNMSIICLGGSGFNNGLLLSGTIAPECILLDIDTGVASVATIGANRAPKLVPTSDTKAIAITVNEKVKTNVSKADFLRRPK